MTTTAFDDRFTPSTQTIESVHAPYEPVAILKRNVAELELALKRQTERAEKTEAELAKLRELPNVPIDAEAFEIHRMNRLIAADPKMNAPSSLTDEQIHAAYRNALGQSIRERDMPEIRKFAPVPAPHKGATHCDDCGLTWLDDGLNPLRCPYCKDAVPAPAVSVVCKDCGQSWTDSTAHANLCVAEMLRQDTKQAPAVQLVDGSDDYYDYLGALVEQHPAGVMRRNTDDKAPAVPTVDRAFESYCDNRAVLNGAPGELKDTTPAVPDDPLLCDTCGADCGCNPWHYSKDDQHHLHACGDCHEDCIAVNERNARRYLALRKVGVQVPGYDFVKFDWSLDAAADRLLEGGK